MSLPLGRRVLLSLALLTFVPTGTVRTAEPPIAKKYAVLVGINQYDHTKLKPLKYAGNDVTEMAAVLQKAGYEVILLSDDSKDERKPTKANIDSQLETVLRKCKRGDTVLVGLAGHGLQFTGEKDCYFCPQDARPFKDETKTLLSLDKIYHDMDRSFASMKVLLVDACRDDPNPGRSARGIDADSAPTPPKGVAALYSCSAGQRAFEIDELKHGVFFHYILEGLRGAAKDSDEEVTFESLSAYVRKQVGRRVPQLIDGAKQSPNLKADLSGEALLLLKLGPGEGRPSGTPQVERDPQLLAKEALRRGNEHYQKEEVQKALTAYTEAIKLDPKLKEAYIKRAELYMNGGDESNGDGDLRMVVKLDPTCAHAIYFQGAELCEKGDLDGGIAECKKALQLDKRLALAYTVLSWAYNEKGLPDRAIEEAATAINLEPRLSFAYSNRAWARWQKQDYKNAVDDATKAIQVGSKNPYAYHHRGNSYLDAGYPEWATRDYTRAIELKSDYAWAYFRRGVAYRQLGKENQARADQAHALRLDPNLLK